MISIVMDSNERGTDRADALQKYLMRHPKEYDFAFGEVEVDLVFHLMSNEANPNVKPYIRKSRAVELKMPADFVQSLQNGHLAEQRRGCPYPLRIAVLGSLGDVMRALPTVTKAGWRNSGEQAQAEGMVLRGIVALQASGVEVDFGMSPLDWRAPKGTHEAIALSHNIAQTMRRAEYILRSKIDLPRARCESAQEAMLRCLPGVGPETARAMLSRNIVPWVAKTNDRGEMWSVSEGELMELPGIGKKRAEKILKALDG